MCDTNTYIAFKARSMSHCDIHIFYMHNDLFIWKFCNNTVFCTSCQCYSSQNTHIYSICHSNSWPTQYILTWLVQECCEEMYGGKMYRYMDKYIRSTCRNHMKSICAILAVLLELIQSVNSVACSKQLPSLSLLYLWNRSIFKKLSAQTVPRCSLISKSNMFHGACVNVILFIPSLCQFLRNNYTMLLCGDMLDQISPKQVKKHSSTHLGKYGCHSTNFH